MNDPVSAYFRLRRGEDEFLNSTLVGLINRMQAEVAAGDFSAALARMQQLEAASQAKDRLERASVHLERALAACQMHDPTLATRQLEKTLDLLGPGAARSRMLAHPYAVANWLLGLLNMPLSDPCLSAAMTWQNSLQAFEYLSTEPGLSRSDQGWYLERRAEMIEAIDAALDGRPAGPALQQATLQPGKITAIEVFDELSIARFGSPGLPPKPAGQLRLQPAQEGFNITGQPYRLFCLRGPNRLLAFDPTGQYCALRVSGDWMNRVEVDPGDYVLLQFQGGTESGDIVAVEIFDWNSSARINHLFKDKEAILLRPQSKNPAHKALKFGPDEGDRYHIYGTVLGVFKSAEPGPPPPAEEPFQEQQAEEAPIPVEDFLRTFPVYAEIPAGDPGALPTFTGRYVELDRFIIDDWPYFIVNVNDKDRKIKPRPKDEIIILRVSGNSMNNPEKADIQNGDYVLLRYQDSAEDGDIVAGVIHGMDTLATLKRYRERNGEIMLLPESIDAKFDDPKYRRIYEMSDLESSEAEPPFYIRGVALAVLKPYPESNP